jgi:hypothetical protein
MKVLVILAVLFSDSYAISLNLMHVTDALSTILYTVGTTLFLSLPVFRH